MTERERDADMKQLRELYPRIRTKQELVAEVQAEYRREHPGRFKNVTEEEAVALAMNAFGKYLR